MADGLESSPFANFSIEDTMDMGMGNAELLKDLVSPETQTASPEEIEEIKPEESKKKDIKKPDVKEKLKALEEQKAEKERLALEAQEALKKDLLGDEEEEPLEEPKEDDDKEELKEGEEGVEEVSRYEALAKDLAQLGVFTKDEDEEDIVIKTPEELLDRFNYEKKKGAIETVNNFIGQFGEDYQQAFEAIFVNGANPKDYFNTYNSIQNFSEMDLTQESNQEAIVRQFYTEQGLQPEAIKNKIEKLKSYGDLEDESKNLHEVLVKKEAQKLTQLEQESKLKLQQQAAIKQQYVQNVQNVLNEKLKAKEFDGIPLNPKIAGELQDFLISEKWKTPSGETLTDFDKTILDLKRPENHATKVKIALLLKILEKDPTLATIQKTGVTKKTNTLFGELAKNKDVKPATKKSEPPKSWFS